MGGAPVTRGADAVRLAARKSWRRTRSCAKWGCRPTTTSPRCSSETSGRRRTSGFPLGLCYQFYHYRLYQFEPDNYVIGLISFVSINYQGGSQGKPLKPSEAQRGLSCQRFPQSSITTPVQTFEQFTTAGFAQIPPTATQREPPGCGALFSSILQPTPLLLKTEVSLLL